MKKNIIAAIAAMTIATGANANVNEFCNGLGETALLMMQVRQDGMFLSEALDLFVSDEMKMSEQKYYTMMLFDAYSLPLSGKTEVDSMTTLKFAGRTYDFCKESLRAKKPA